MLHWVFMTAVPAPQVVLTEMLQDEEAAVRVRAHLTRASAETAQRLGRPKLKSALEAHVARNLIDKLAGGYTLDPATLERTVVGYELFKAETFARAGVFPKRYFGYFDEQHDTAAHERRMRQTIVRAVQIANAYLAEVGSKVRITDMEVAITFIAEGGALLLMDDRQDLTKIHPVLGVGLDDIRIGYDRHSVLVDLLDDRLAQTSQRFMTFEEAIHGTVVMWVYEKLLAARKLKNAEKKHLHTLPLDEQFIFASLVYNSGLIFSTERMRMIRDLKTADYLARVSKQNEKKRWPLPVFTEKRSLSLLAKGYPAQPTSWAAVYHILQRYGAYVAMNRFTDVFDHPRHVHSKRSRGGSKGTEWWWTVIPPVLQRPLELRRRVIEADAFELRRVEDCR